MINSNSKILVTGSAGVLGTAVLAKLVEYGFCNILAPRRGLLDLSSRDETMEFFGQHQPEIVIHLASLVYGLGGNLKNQMLSVVENTAINNSLFEAMNVYPPKKIFFAGTVASYPYPYVSMPLTEVDLFNGLPHYGEFGYAMAKRHAFSYLEILQRERGVPYVYGVFTNLYGENDRFDSVNGHVIPSLIAKAHIAREQGVDLEVWGDGLAERDFLHSSDAAAALVFLTQRSDLTGVFNISSNRPTKIATVAQMVARNMGIQNIVFLKDKPVGIPRRVVCNQKLLASGFQLSVSLEEGIRLTCNDYLNSQCIRV